MGMDVMKKMAGLLAAADHFLAPPLCPLCRENLTADGEICEECEKKLPLVQEPRCMACGGPVTGLVDLCEDCAGMEERPWYRGVSAFLYQDEIRHAVHRFKYRGGTYLARFFAHRMADAWKRGHGLAAPEVITAVPLHWLRAWKRGYNQSFLLAERIGEELGIPARQLLMRRRPTMPQARLDRKQRLKNLHGAFAVRRDGNVSGLSVLLVDDVFTTGSTLAEAARTLQEAEAAEISVLTIARD